MADISINELRLKNELSVRSLNLCKSLSLDMLSDVITYYQQNHNFLKIRNCGSKSNIELINLCEFHIANNTLSLELEEFHLISDESSDKTILHSFDKLSSYKKALFQTKFNILNSKLSNRAKNGLINSFGVIDSYEFIQKLLSNRFIFNNLKNIGVKTTQELEDFRSATIYLVKELIVSDENLNLRNYSEIFSKTILTKLPLQSDNYIDFFDENGFLKLFKFINYLIDSEQIFNSKQKIAFEYLYIKNSNFSNLEQVINELKVTYERFRQIRVRLSSKLRDHFLFLENIQLDNILTYSLNSDSNMLIIDEEFCRLVNENEKTSFDRKFITFVYHILLRNKFNNLLKVDSIPENYNLQIDNLSTCNFLISISTYNSFDFKLFLFDFENRLSENRTKSDLLNLRMNANKYILNSESFNINTILDLLKTILSNAYKIFSASDDNVVLPPNKKKKAYEYYYNIIENNDKPINVKELTIIANKLYPFLNTTDERVRAILGKEKDIFIYFGRSSTYGLKIWELQKSGIKGGTIKDIVKLYLESKSEPMKISDIVAHVNKFRSTNEKSVLTNLKLDGKENFIFYKGEVVGLKSKYEEGSNFELLTERKSWLERFNWLKEFKAKNPSKEPSAISEDINERTAYNLLYKSKNKFKKGILSREQENLIRSLGYELEI